MPGLKFKLEMELCFEGKGHLAFILHGPFFKFGFDLGLQKFRRDQKTYFD